MSYTFPQEGHELIPYLIFFLVIPEEFLQNQIFNRLTLQGCHCFDLLVLL